MRHRARQTFFVLGTVGLFFEAAAAQPRLEVRSRSVLQISLRLDGEVLTASGALNDDVGAPVARDSIELLFSGTTGTEVTRAHLSIVTDAAGQFNGSLLVEPAREWRVDASFGGQGHNDAVEATARAQVRKTPVLVAFRHPSSKTIDLDRDEVEIALQATAERPFAGLFGSIRDELGRLITTGEFDQSGQWSAHVPTDRFGAAGIGRLAAETAETPTHAPGKATLDVVRVHHSYATLRNLTNESSVQIGGVLTDARNLPLADQTIAVTLNARRFATVITDFRGMYSVDGGNLPRGQLLRFAATHEASAPWWLGGHSPSLTVTLPSPWRPAWWLLTLAAATSAALLVRVGRPRALSNLLEARKLTKRPGEADVDFATDSTDVGFPNGVRGQVVDTGTLRPIPGVLVQYTTPEGPHSVVTEGNGDFALDDLPAGSQTLSFIAAGYAETTIKVAIPHRGAWNGARVRLQSHRQLALKHYQRGLVAWFGRSVSAALVTTRDALALKQTRFGAGPRNSFRELTADFERAYYSKATPTVDDLTLVSKHADDVEQAIGQTQAESFDGPRGPSL